MRSKTEDERATASFLERHLVCTVSATAGADPDGRVARFWVDEWGQPGKVGPIRVGGGGWGNPRPLARLRGYWLVWRSPAANVWLHAAQYLRNDDLSDHRDRVHQGIAQRHARIGVRATVRKGQDRGLRLCAAE